MEKQDINFLNFVRDMKKYTMIPIEHTFFLKNVLDFINKENITGDIVECGVWKGGCIMIMQYLQKKFNDNKIFWLYDTFQGMTEPVEEFDGDNAQNIWKDVCISSLNEVKNNVSEIKYNNDNIRYVVGDVCKTLEQSNNLPDEISILRLDTDWYESTKKELDVLYNKVVDNGIIIIDDYYCWQGSRKAVDEFIVGKNIKILNLSYTGSRFCFQKIDKQKPNNLHKYLTTVKYNTVYFTEKKQIVSHSTNNSYGNTLLEKYKIGDVIKLNKDKYNVEFNIVNKTEKDRKVVLYFNNELTNDLLENRRNWVII